MGRRRQQTRKKSGRGTLSWVKSKLSNKEATKNRFKIIKTWRWKKLTYIKIVAYNLEVKKIQLF